MIDISIEGKSVEELRELNAQGLIRRHEIPEYKVWQNMKNRCNNPNTPEYHHYGGRGISIYPEWGKDFFAWFEHIGRRPIPGLTLERINNNLGYYPGNVRWDTYLAQNNNHRKEKSTKVTDEAVDVIRSRRGIELQADTALEFGISRPHVSVLQSGLTRNPEGFERPPNLRTGVAGERHPNAVLTDADAANIKGLLLLNPHRGFQSELARRYGVSKYVIHNIATGRTWTHVQPSLHPVMPPYREPPIKRRMGL